MSLRLLLIGIAVVATAGEEAFSLSKFDHFVKVPSESLHAGGRLTERHIGYLSEVPYASILSISDFPTNDTAYNGVSGSFPSSSYEITVASGYGLAAVELSSSLTVDFLNTFVQTVDELKSPVYVHCHVGYTATLFIELYKFIKGELKASSDLYSSGLKFGWDYQSNADVVAFVNEVTGAQDEVHSECIEQSLAQGEASYKDYYWAHRAGHSDLWFNVGQILDTHVPSIQTAGYKSVISFRDNAEATNKLPSEDSATAGANNNEFSDAAGLYNVTVEQQAVTAAGLAFFHLPLVSGSTTTWTVEQYQLYLPTLQQAEALGPVLAHCASGYRSAAYVLAYLGSSSKQCVSWALSEAADLGIVYNSTKQSDTDKQVVAFLQQVLGC